MGCILDLSVDHYLVRVLMKQWGAIRLIEGLMHTYSNFRTANGYMDNLLLSSSRKALVSLDDSHLNTLLLEWKNAKFPRMLDCGDEIEKQKQRNTELWHRIAPFLA